MRLIDCHIVNFGCLSERSYSFRDGLNVLLADNGSGKSTLAVFLKAMLYGLPVSGKRTLKDNERKRYKPWNGGVYGGALSFEADGKQYRIERFFGAKERDDRFALYNLATGNLSTDYSENLGEELFGIDADGFERTLYISQRYPDLSPNNNSILKKLGTLFTVSEDLGDYENADAVLDTARKHYKTTGERGRIYDLSREAMAKEEEIRTADAAALSAAALAEECNALQEQKKELLQKAETARENRAAAEKRRLLEETGASYRRLRDAADNEKRILLPLNAFFSKHLPSENDVLDAEFCLKRAEEYRAKLSVSPFSEEDNERLKALQARYGEAPPTAAEANELRQKLSCLREAQRAEEANAKKENAEFDRLYAHFGDAIPEDADVEALHRATDSYDNALANATVAAANQKHTLPLSLPPLLASIGAIASAAAAVCGFILGALWLGVAGLILAVACAVGAVFLHRAFPPPRNVALEDLSQKKTALIALIAPYRYTEESDPSVCAKLLFRDLARYRTLYEEEKRRRERFAIARAETEECRGKMRDALLRYGITDEPESGFVRFEKETELLTALCEASRSADSRRESLEIGLAQETARIDAFLAHFDELKGIPHAQAIAAVREKLLLSHDALLRYKDITRKLDAFLTETSYDPEAPLPPYIGESETFAHEEKEVTQALLALEKQIAEKTAEEAHQNEIAAAKAAATCAKAAIEEEKAEAEHTFELIQMTRQFLADSKEYLSTRYVKDIESHFSRHLASLSQKDEKFAFNTDLALSVERMGERRDIEVLSRGEQDLLAFCARLALIDAIYEKEIPFLLLDDPFVNLDDRNYKNALDLLASIGTRFQILYTVCSAVRLPS